MNWRLFWRRSGSEAPSAKTHQDLLERQLLAAYDAKGIQGAPHRRPWVRFAPAMAVILTLVTASQVPASYPVTVGKRISIEFSAGEPPETAAKALAQAVSGMDVRLPRIVSIRMVRKQGGPTVLTSNVWGDALLPDGTILERLRALPEFADRQISIAALEGKIQDNVTGLVRHRFFHSTSTPEARERARQKLVEKIRRAEGADATIDVQVEGDETQEQVRIKVWKPR